MKICFSEEKLIKQFGNPAPFLREPLFQLTYLFLNNYFLNPLFVKILKIRTSPVPVILFGKETMNGTN